MEREFLNVHGRKLKGTDYKIEPDKLYIDGRYVKL